MEGGRRPLGRENRQNLRRLCLREPPASKRLYAYRCSIVRGGLRGLTCEPDRRFRRHGRANPPAAVLRGPDLGRDSRVKGRTGAEGAVPLGRYLPRGAHLVGVGAKDAAIPCARSEGRGARFAPIAVLARVRRHRLDLREPALGAGDASFGNHVRSVAAPDRRGVRWASCLVDARAPKHVDDLLGAHLPAGSSLSTLVVVRELRLAELILTVARRAR
jgi:hypothetical protein